MDVVDYLYQLLNVPPCNMPCCSHEVGMLSEASAEGKIPPRVNNMYHATWQKILQIDFIISLSYEHYVYIDLFY